MVQGTQVAQILIVDDIPENIRVLADALEPECEVYFALNSNHALQFIEQQAPDLVLLDVMMPETDGLETLRRLRAVPWGREIPVIMVTADDRPETQIAGLALGVDDFITKPLLLAAVIHRIRNTLARYRFQKEQARLLHLLKNTNVELQRLSEMNAVLLASAGVGICSTNLDGICTSMNPTGLAMLGYHHEELIGRNQHAWLHHHHPDGSRYLLEECPIHLTLHDGETRIAEDHFICKNGTALPIQMTVSAMRVEGLIVGAEVIFQDISERQRVQQELYRLATTDVLTGVYNRRHFFERGDAECERAARYGQLLACLMLDLDHFKAINDTRGHAAGDVVLKTFADIVSGLLRKADIFGRIGGEEFAVLLPQTDVNGGLAFAERVRWAVSEHSIPYDQAEIHVTVSIGVAALSPHDQGLESILARADRGLYAAKTGGRNRAVADMQCDAPA